MPNFIIISGCSGGGKSTLIEALRQAGEAVIEEPGRRVIAAEWASGGHAFPWEDMNSFIDRIIAVARSDLRHVHDIADCIFLDRGLIDAAVALEHFKGVPASETIGSARFHSTVFLAPPWPEIHVADADRRHDLTEAIDEYHRLASAYRRLGYVVRLLPKVSVTERLAFILDETRGI